jgi:amidase
LDGVVEFAPSFGTVGVLAESGPDLEAAGLALIGSGSRGAAPSGLWMAGDLLAQADRAVGAAVEAAARRMAAALGVPFALGDLSGGEIDRWLVAFRGRQFVEAWHSHGTWIRSRRPRLGPGIAARFAAASRTSVAEAGAAGPAGDEVRTALEHLVPPGWAVVLPSAATVAPAFDVAGPAKEDLRVRTLRLTCVAGLGGLPAVSVPHADVDGLPVGVCLVGRRGDDERLLAAARDLSRS